MSLYKDQEKLASVYHPDDSNTTKIATYPETADFTILMNIIRRNEDTIALAGAELGEYVANVNGSYTNASSIRKGDKVTWDSEDYIVVNKPRYLKLFNDYKIVFRKQS